MCVLASVIGSMAFVCPKMEDILRTTLLNCAWVKDLDDMVRRMVKKAFQLPWRNHHLRFYALCKHGRLGLPNMENDLDVM